MEGRGARSSDGADDLGAPPLDDLGLLVPSERTQAGHRLYDQEDVRRLLQDRCAGAADLPLEEVARVLGDERIGLADTVRRDLERVGHGSDGPVGGPVARDGPCEAERVRRPPPRPL